MDTVKLASNLERIKATIAEIRVKAGFNPDGVEIVAASKSRTIEEVKALSGLGVGVFGENRVQELMSKYDPTVKWDMIGRLQTNKVKYLIGKVRLIQSVDRLNLAAEIDRLAKKLGTVQEILMEINTGEEENKGGVTLAEGEAFAKELAAFGNIRLAGVMAVTPIDVGDCERRELFKGVGELYEKLKAANPEVRYLSMGMSDDYPLAVECGANMVRLGRILFE